MCLTHTLGTETQWAGLFTVQLYPHVQAPCHDCTEDLMQMLLCIKMQSLSELRYRCKTGQNDRNCTYIKYLMVTNHKPGK